MNPTIVMERQIACIWNMNLKGEDGLIPGVTAIISKLCARQQVKKWSLNNCAAVNSLGTSRNPHQQFPDFLINLFEKRYLLIKSETDWSTSNKSHSAQ